jgi:hypothetical protein
VTALAVLVAGSCVALLVEACFVHWESRIERKTRYLAEAEARALKAIENGECNICRRRIARVVQLFDQDGAS